MSYNSYNIFSKILRGEVPCKKIYEDDYAFAFYDINPKAPVHALVIPKGPYMDFADFAKNASPKEIDAFQRAIVKVVEITKIGPTGYRLISNTGVHSGQEVQHYHVHVLGGRLLGPMLAV